MSRPLMRRRPTRAVIGATSLALAVTGLGGFFAGSANADPAGDSLVIQEVYGGGGNSGAPYTNDYIELYNPTDAAVDLTGWSVEYLSKSGGSGGATALSGSIGSHGRYLIQEAKGSGGASALPSPDATGALAMSGTDGSVELLDADAVVDTVGFGAASVAEGTAMPALSNTTAGARTALGVDTDDNAADFSVVAPAPQNAAGKTAPDGVQVTAPGNKTFPVGSAITPIKLAATGASGSYTWAADNLPDGLTLDGDTISGTPTTSGATTVTVTATDAADDTVSGKATFTITVSAPARDVSIADIQTADPSTSPLINQAVTTTGVVTADYATGGLNGFYLQTGGTGGGTDATPGESDAIFVYGSISAGQVKVGDSVSVTGTVQWYQGALEISSPTVTPLAEALPAVTPASIAWSDLDDDAKKYAHEGELMAPAGDFTVTDNYNANFYGELELAAGDQMLKQPTDVGAAGSQAARDQTSYNASHGVFLDDGSSWTYGPTSHADTPMPWLTPSTPVSDGAKVTFHAPVVLEYRNSQWNFQPQSQVTGDGSAVATFSDMRSAKAAPTNVGSDVRLATFNMENFFTTTGQAFVAANSGAKCTYYNDRNNTPIGDDNCTFADGSAGPRGAATDAAYQKQLQKEVTSINGLGASVISLEEVENAAKFGEDRDATVSAIVSALNAADGAGTWAYVPSPAAADLPPLDQQDVIRTAFIYKPAAITPVGVSHVLTGDSGAGQPFSIAREPMAQGFKATGASDSDDFMVVANHLKSKGADASSLYGDCGPDGTIGVTTGGTDDSEPSDPSIDQGGFNCTRVHQVHDMWEWAQGQAKTLGTDKIFLVGDFNAYDHEDPLEYLYSQGFTDTGSQFDADDSSYSYGGLEGSLDHVLASPAALKMVTGADIWQINAQESVAYAYSRDNYNATELFDGSTPWATSDHDPEVVGLDLPTTQAPSHVTVTRPGNRSFTTGTAITPFTLSASGGSGSYTFSVDHLPAGLVLRGVRISGTPTGAGVTTVTVKATDAADATVAGTATFTITVKAAPSKPAPPASHPVTHPTAHEKAVAHAKKAVTKAQKKLKRAKHKGAQAKHRHGAHSAAVKAAKKHIKAARKHLRAAKAKLAAVERQS